MQENLVKFSITEFEGVRNWELDSRIPKSNMYEANNAIFTGKIFQNIKGVTEYLTEQTSGTNIKGLYYFPHEVGSVNTNFLVEYYNKIFTLVNTDADTSAVVAGTTFTVDEDIGGVVYNNEFYAVSPNNGMGYIDTNLAWGNTFTGTPPAGTMLEINSEKMWAAGLAGFPSVLYYSRSASAANPTYIRDWTTGAGSVLVGKGGHITAIRNLKNTLYVFKNDTIYYLSSFDTSGSYPIPIFSIYAVTSGAINNTAVTQVENDLWFLTPQLEVRSLGSVAQYISDDARTTDVSLAIKRYLDVLDPDQSGAAMKYFNNILRISLKGVGSPYNNFELTYDFNVGGYSFRSLASVKFYETDTVELFFCETGTSGKLFKADNGWTNKGNAYSMQGKTMMVDLGDPALYKQLRYINVYAARSANHEIEMCVYEESFDDSASICYTLAAPTSDEIGPTAAGDDGTYGSGTWGSSVWGGSGSLDLTGDPAIYRKLFRIDVNLTARQFGLDLSAVINGGRVQLYQIDFEFVPLPETSTPITN